MKITGADHTNWRVKDLERSLRFYRDVLGFEPFGLEEYRRQERPIVSLRVTPEFILHLPPTPLSNLSLPGATTTWPWWLRRPIRRNWRTT